MLEFLVLLLAIVLVNLPFGYWREGVKKFSPAWFVAVHAAVPVIVVMRMALDIEWRLVNLPFMVAAYFVGQTIGARMRRRRGQQGE
ncbi:MAG: hypothetical protein WBN65_11300 [Gammaproteobacteria bacterium]